MTRLQGPQTEGSQEDDGRDTTSAPSMTSRFLRGLSLGALVGAAIAGSAMWDRWRRGDEHRTEEPLDQASGPD